MTKAFEKGETLYTQAGATVVFDHEHGGNAFVHPLITTIMQSASYHGDDFHEEEDQVEADHLITVPMEKLSRRLPVDVIDTQIIEKRKVLAEIEAATKAAQRRGKEAVLGLDREIVQRNRDLKAWEDKYPVFADTARFLAGLPMFPLHAHKSHYTKCPDIPTIPKVGDMRLLRLRPVKDGGHNLRPASRGSEELEWVAVDKDSSHDSYDREITLMFFESAEARQEHISTLYDEVLAKFRAAPDYKSSSYSSSLDMGTLRQWVSAYEFLVVPADILEGEKTHHEVEKEAKRIALQRQLEALGDDTHTETEDML